MLSLMMHNKSTGIIYSVTCNHFAYHCCTAQLLYSRKETAVIFSQGLVVFTGVSWPHHISFFWLIYHPWMGTWQTTANHGCSHSHTRLWAPLHSEKNWARAGQNSNYSASTKCLKKLLEEQKEVPRVTKIYILWKLGWICFHYRKTKIASSTAAVQKGNKKFA